MGKSTTSPSLKHFIQSRELGEMMNRILNESTTSIKIHSGISKTFWLH